MKRVAASLWLGVFSAVTGGCEPPEADPRLDLVSESVLSASPAQPTQGLAQQEEANLRRAYTLAEMKLGECLTLTEDGGAVGKNCPSGCVIFGPYLSAPSNSDVWLSLEIEPRGFLAVASDLVSNGGGLVYGALDVQSVDAREKQQLAYRVHLFQPASWIEARLWIQSETPSNFKITKFNLEVK